MTVNLTPMHLLAGVAALLGFLAMWRAGARRKRKAEEAARAGARLLSLFGRVLFTAGLIVGVQWIVLANAADNRGLLLAVLGLPALFAAHALTKALTVTTVDTPQGRGGKR